MPEESRKGLMSDAEATTRITGILVVLLLAGLLVGFLDNLLVLLDISGLSGLWRVIVDFFQEFWPVWKVAVLFLAIICIAWAIYSYIKLQQVISEEEKIFGKPADEAFLDNGSTTTEKENEKWLRIKEHANSANSADWRLAIIEADIMLEEVLRAAGYHGEGIGEMLKSVDKSDMLTLDAAWDAHKVRNRIAHTGGDFNLDERETKRVIALFESVFREFQVI